MEKFIKDNIKNQEGVTILEMLIYISLTAAITVVFTSFTADVLRSSGKAMAIKEVSQSARILSSRIGQEIKTAKQINSISADQISLTDFEDNTLIFSYDAANDLVNFDDGSGAVQISNDSVRVTNFVFNQISPQAVALSMGVDQKNPNLPDNRQYHFELTTTIVPRPGLY